MVDRGGGGEAKYTHTHCTGFNSVMCLCVCVQTQYCTVHSPVTLLDLLQRRRLTKTNDEHLFGVSEGG